MGRPMDRSNRVFVELGRFDEAFPSLEDVLVEYSYYNYGRKMLLDEFGLSMDSLSFHMRDAGGLLSCPNPKCYRGGFQFDLEVSTMLRDGISERSVKLSCPGDEGTPKVRKGRHCSYSVQGKITLIPKVPG